jgi:hypothetical protein
MPKTSVQVNVNFNTTPPTCSPDPVNVSQASNSGITWKANQSGYTFTGVTITPSPAGEFGTPDIQDVNGKSQMTVTDGVTDYDDHTYTLEYTDPQGNAGRYDPKIKNEH